MLKPVGKESPDAKKLVLGFDAGCFTCLELAKRIKERLGNKLEVHNLRDPQVEQWRKIALEENAPWVPALFEINGTKVRAWTGWRLGLALTRFLGPSDTWRVMQVLGEMGTSRKVEGANVVEKLPTRAAEAVANMSRGQFLKGVGGTAVALSILSATGKLASPAEAASSSHKEIEGSELISVARRAAQSRDFVNVAGKKWSDRVQRGTILGRSCYNKNCFTVISFGRGCTVIQDNDKLRLDGDCIAVKAARVKDKNNSWLAVSYVLPADDRIIHYHEYDKPIQPKRGNFKIESRAKLWEVEGKRMHLEKYSANGRQMSLHRRRASQGEFEVQSDTCEDAGGCWHYDCF